MHRYVLTDKFVAPSGILLGMTCEKCDNYKTTIKFKER